MRHSKPVRLKTAPTGLGCGAVENRPYRGAVAVRLQTAPTGGESVHLFLESTINQSAFRISKTWGCRFGVAATHESP